MSDDATIVEVEDTMITIRIPKREYMALAEILYLGRLAATELIEREKLKRVGADHDIPPSQATRLKNPLDILNQTHYWGRDVLERGIGLAWDVILQAKQQARR